MLDNYHPTPQLPSPLFQGLPSMHLPTRPLFYEVQ